MLVEARAGLRLLVGLGNPGMEHAGNRHNIGFMAVDRICRRHGFSSWRRRFQGQASDGHIGRQRLLALHPLTYMNRSGQSVQAAVNFFKLAPQDVIVIHDELDLAPGKLRVKQGGGAGGHNGLRSIDSHIGQGYWRLRLGIGHPGDKALVHGYVLKDFAKADQDWLDLLLESVASAFSLLLDGYPDKFMSRVAMLTQPPKPSKPSKPDASAETNQMVG